MHEWRCAQLCLMCKTQAFPSYTIILLINDMIWWGMMAGGDWGGWCVCDLSVVVAATTNAHTHTSCWSFLSFFLGRCANFVVAKYNRRHYWWFSPVVTDMPSESHVPFHAHTHTHTHTKAQHSKHGYGSGTSLRNSFHTHTQVEYFKHGYGSWTNLRNYFHTHTQVEHFKHGYGSGPSLRNSFQW
jgi:hypothetical protein